MTLDRKQATQIIRERFKIKRGAALPFVSFVNNTRRDLAKLFADLEFTTGAEIGVCTGEFSEVMLQENPGLRLLAVDPWVAYMSPWHYRVTQERADRRFQDAQAKFAAYPNVKIIRKTSMEALQDVPDGSLDYVYLDGLHDFDNVMLDLIGWSAKVRPSGLISGHDYRPFYGGDVVSAVDAYTRAHGIGEWWITRDKAPSFLWIKK